MANQHTPLKRNPARNRRPDFWGLLTIWFHLIRTNIKPLFFGGVRDRGVRLTSHMLVVSKGGSLPLISRVIAALIGEKNPSYPCIKRFIGVPTPFIFSIDLGCAKW